VLGGDIVPVRSVQDPYPSFHSVAVDPENNRVVMSNSNRGSLLFYERISGRNSADVTKPARQVRGPATGMMFIAGVAMDPVRREVYTVDNDIGDRMLVFPYDAEGNSRPKRVLRVPHGSWGVSLNRSRDEIAISVEHINSLVIYRREAAGGEAPLRVIRGPKTGLADPHGVYFDGVNNEILAANHGNWAPLTKTASSGVLPEAGHFQPPSITTFSGVADGDTQPLRNIQGAQTQLNWPMGINVDTVHNEIAVASYGGNAVLIFHRTDTGDVAPLRVIRGDRTGIVGPMGVALDTKNDELWVTNYGDHSAVVFSRTAQGNVAPKRIIRNAPAGTPAIGLGNPGALAYDSQRDELLVPN
jgi:DNA-binding beta-propeller fold protein YncE